MRRIKLRTKFQVSSVFPRIFLSELNVPQTSSFLHNAFSIGICKQSKSYSDRADVVFYVLCCWKKFLCGRRTSTLTMTFANTECIPTSWKTYEVRCILLHYKLSMKNPRPIVRTNSCSVIIREKIIRFLRQKLVTCTAYDQLQTPQKETNSFLKKASKFCAAFFSSRS